MREIKFRAWIKYQKRMCDVVQLDLIKNRVFIEKDRKNRPVGFVFFDDCDIMQYVGLKDKNGKEIYEGDVVRFVEWSKGEFCWIGKIEFDNCLYIIKGGANKECDSDFEIQLSRIPSERIEIIGNIYENPELSEV